MDDDQGAGLDDDLGWMMIRVLGASLCGTAGRGKRCWQGQTKLEAGPGWVWVELRLQRRECDGVSSVLMGRGLASSCAGPSL